MLKRKALGMFAVDSSSSSDDSNDKEVDAPGGGGGPKVPPDTKKIRLDQWAQTGLGSVDTVEGRQLPGGGGGGDFWGRMRTLNQSFSKAVQDAVAGNPGCSLIPLVGDYMLHTRCLLEASKHGGGGGGGGGSSLAELSLQKLGEYFDNFEEEHVTSGSSSGLPGGGGGNLSAGTSSSTPPYAGFAFFDKVAPPQGQGCAWTPPPTTPGMAAHKHLGGSSSPPMEAMGVDEDDDEDQENCEPPPEKHVTSFQEKDAIYSNRCQVYAVGPGSECKSRGVGTLYIKKLEGTGGGGGKHQIVVRAANSLGRVILNLLLDKSLPLQKRSEDSLLTAEVTGNGGKGLPIIIRVKTGKEAVQLLAKLKECQGGSNQ